MLPSKLNKVDVTTSLKKGNQAGKEKREFYLRLGSKKWKAEV